MLKHSARRWLAGLAVTGALVAASATPAYADDTFEVAAWDLLVAPDHTAYGYIAAYSPEVDLKKVTLDLDLSQVDDFATLDVATLGWDCDQTGANLHCVAEAGEYGIPSFDYYLNAKSDAKPGQKAELAVKAVGDGMTASRTVSVTVAEGVDLQSEPEDSFEAEPGATAGLVGTVVRNSGPETAHGAVLRLQSDYFSPYAGNFSNCENVEGLAAICTFDTDLVPGRSYRLSTPLPVKVDKEARTGSELYNYVDWWTKDDWALVANEYPVPPGAPGTGGKLSLVEESSARQSLVPQTDVEKWNSFTEVSITVLGDNTADLAATGATATGRVGDKVKVSPGFRNLGPATVETWREQGPTLVVEVPNGTTAVEVSEECAPYAKDGDQPWNPFEHAGEPGAALYGCISFNDLKKGDTHSYDFVLKIDELSGETSGKVNTQIGGDPQVANNEAALVVKLGDPAPTTPATPTPGTSDEPGTGGGDGGSLPITGTATGLIAGIGALLVAAGIGGYVVARRRKTRFVA
jgi:LPXTG-motif cell wall-anchored protein